jgi:hypothetical protein
VIWFFGHYKAHRVRCMLRGFYREHTAFGVCSVNSTEGTPRSVRAPWILQRAHRVRCVLREFYRGHTAFGVCSVNSTEGTPRSVYAPWILQRALRIAIVLRGFHRGHSGLKHPNPILFFDKNYRPSEFS